MTDRAGAIAVFAGASVWGLFWIPLRYMDSLGISALWALSLVMATAVLPASILATVRGELKDLALPDTWKAGLALGLATNLYFVAIVHTDVIRAIFLFYLLPVWTTLSARLIYGEPLTGNRLLVILIAFVGLWLLLGIDNALPVPKSLGDWCAIASGFCWGVSLSLLHGNMRGGAYSRSLVAIASALVLSLIAAWMFNLPGALVADYPITVTDIESQTQGLAIVAVAVGFGMLALYPAMLAQIWGARRIPAPTAALLTMSEIVVAVISAAVLIGTDLPPQAMLGGCIIVVALCIDIAIQFTGNRQFATKPDHSRS